MEPKTAVSPLTRDEQETKTEATRLIALIEDALSVVAIQSGESDSLEASADRIERAARDLSVACASWPTNVALLKTRLIKAYARDESVTRLL
jgi:hypothetical protein